MLKPVDAARGNGRLFDEVGNRGSKAMLHNFQKAKNSRDPTTAEEFGDGALMDQGYTLLWLGWQWDVPNGQMRMDMPIATDHGKKITGLVRGNFIPNDHSPTQPLADRNHLAYPIDDPEQPRQCHDGAGRSADTPQLHPARRNGISSATPASRSTAASRLGRIYDVVYRARDPRVVGTGLAGTARSRQLPEARPERRQSHARDPICLWLGRFAERPLSAAVPL